MNPHVEHLAEGVRLYLGDCADILPTLPIFDAVVTDPPYGIGEAAGKARKRKPGATAFKRRDGSSYVKDYGDDAWDDAPIPDELMALVKASGRWKIIFGGKIGRAHV